MDNYKYTISIISMFKNESMIMNEWIEHYISEGIQHFYLIDNGSTDHYINILNKYNEKITLIVDSDRTKETQNTLMNKHFLNRVKKESEWIIICDVDEYIYSRNQYKTILDYIHHIPKHIETILLPWKNFGNNHLVKQPKHIVSSFTMREDIKSYVKTVKHKNNLIGYCKSLIKTKHLKQLENHCSKLNAQKLYFSDFSKANINLYNMSQQNLHINHYQTMSLEYYTNVKMKRGNGQDSHNYYTLDRFKDQQKYFNVKRDYELKRKTRKYKRNTLPKKLK